MIYTRSSLTAELKESSSPFYVDFNPIQSTWSGNNFIEPLLENWQTMENGVWRFLHLRCCGIGPPKRSFSFSINKGEAIFIWSVLDLQVFGTWMYRYCPLFMWCWIWNWRFTCKYFHTRMSVGNTAVLISKIDIFAASLYANRYSSCSN